VDTSRNSGILSATLHQLMVRTACSSAISLLSSALLVTKVVLFRDASGHALGVLAQSPTEDKGRDSVPPLTLLQIRLLSSFPPRATARLILFFNILYGYPTAMRTTARAITSENTDGQYMLSKVSTNLHLILLIPLPFPGHCPTVIYRILCWL